jgi:flagellar basal-body rod modification protein FlgD
MAIPATTSSTATDPIAATANTTDAASTSDRFLKLLVAQMKNQDPLSPMDNAQVTSQMAQINTVSGIEKLNATVTGLTTQFTQLQALQGAALVGHSVIVPGNKLDISNAVGQGGFELATSADAVKVEVLGSAGQVVDTLNLGAQTAGVHSFDWQAGTATNADGLTFRVTATTGTTSTAGAPLMRDLVTAVSTSGNTFNLELASSGTLPYSSIKAFN